MTAEGVSGEQQCIGREDDCAYTKPEISTARSRVFEPHRLPCVVQQDKNKNDGEVKKEAVNILQNQRKGIFTQICFARLAHTAGRRVSPERFIVCAAIVITGESETTWRPQDEQRR